MGLDVDAFLLEVQGAPAAAETAVSVRSDTIMVMNAPYISLVSGEEAVSALREILPAARCPFRPRGLSFDCGSGPVWRLEYRLPGTSGGSPRGGTAVVRALDGSVAAWGASGKATGASRDPSASGEARH